MPRARVLVVEDQPLAAKDVEATLSVMDYEVIDIVRKGEQAVETVAEDDPDVVLMDILLAGDMDGIEAAQRIQESLDVPVVFLTAHAEPETVSRAKQFGPYGYISKPVDPVELRTAIEVALHKRELDEEAERRRIELASFAHTISEQFRGPLESIQGHLARIHEEAEQLPQEAQRSLEQARRESEQADEMIEGLLAYAEAGDIDPGESSDADEALDEVLDRLSERLEQTGAEVQREPLGRVQVPEDQLVWLLGNLVENAIEHGNPEQPTVEISSEEDEGDAILRVRDNGPGIEPGVREHVFELFHRGDVSEGPGVGLAVCKRIAETAGGGIWVESEPGEGSVFIVRLPRTEGGD